MAQASIIEKLTDLLNTKLPFTEECQAVYLLVEIRKLLDRENNRRYPLLRFYCNWSVHTDKDSTREMREIMTDIFGDVEQQIKQQPLRITKKTKIISFTYMEDLQGEMALFLNEYGLPTSLTTRQEHWFSLVTLLVAVLADQPINAPCDQIKTFSFSPAAPGCVFGQIDFTNDIEGQDCYKFGDTY